jgi:phosphatidylglycerophosphatase A
LTDEQVRKDGEDSPAAGEGEVPAGPRERGFGPELVRALGSFFYVGHLPLFPGTWGSAAAGGIYAALWAFGGLNTWTVIALAGGFALVSVPLGTRAEKAWGAKDPGQFVLDEFAGFFVTLILLKTYTIPVGFLGFVLFRFFDTVKVWPARRLEGVGGGLGILLDDVAAGLYANLTLRVLLHIVGPLSLGEVFLR